MNTHALIIQGGMGAGVSDYRLANAVSRLGQLGVVSGTALDEILIRRLQLGDPSGDMRRALDRLPFPQMAERIWSKWFIPGGKARLASYRTLPAHAFPNSHERMELCIAANFVEVYLAREGHPNSVGINYLEKVQIPHLASIYGAMLAGVRYVLMGAGIPLKIPAVLEAFVRHEGASYPLHVVGAHEGEEWILQFDPADFFESGQAPLPPLERPMFLPIISSNTLALTLLKRANGPVDGFVIEGATAGGHNAPPRGKLQLNDKGEPVYGVRDAIDLAKIRELGLPFWLAGGFGSAEKLQTALSLGATGIQVGTAFACCEESGLRDDYKQALLQKAVAGEAQVFTDPLASPTGFPFKVAQLETTASDQAIVTGRPRICDLGFLRETYRTAEGAVGYRCAAEPVSCFIAKGGQAEDCAGRKCVCNALMANIGLEQIRNGRRVEVGLVTMGDDLQHVGQFLGPDQTTYSARDVIATLLRHPYVGEISVETTPELCGAAI